MEKLGNPYEMGATGRFQHLPQSHTGEADVWKYIGNLYEMGATGRFQHLPRSHTGELEFVEIHKKSN